MKICLLHRYPENHIKATNAAFPYFVEELRSRGHNVTVSTFKKFDRLSPGKTLKSLLWILYAPFLVLGRKYDVIYCDDSFPFYALLIKWASPKSKVIKRMGDLHLMYYCSGWIYRFFHWFERWEWKACDLLVVITDAMEDYIWKDCGNFKPGPMRVHTIQVPDPIDLNDFPYEPARDDYPIDVLFHGYLNKNKGVEVLLEAARRLPNVYFSIIGDGPDVERLKRIAPANVMFQGWRPYKDMYLYLSSTKIGVAIRNKNPGNDYVITQPVLQYSAVGRPVVVSARKCMSGCVFHNVDELVEQIEALLKDYDLRLKLGSVNRKVMERVHDARKIAKQLAEITV